MIWSCDAAKTPVWVAVVVKAASRAALSNAGAGVVAATLICMIVRVFGPMPGCVEGAPPTEV